MNQKLLAIVLDGIKVILKREKRSLFYLGYYSILEAILLMVAPLTSAFVINSVIAHAKVSIITLSVIVLVIFFGVAILQIIKAYIIEKFEQRIFVDNAIKIALLSTASKKQIDPQKLDKYMNYFFDVIAIQKLLPSIVLNGVALAVKLFISLLLLIVFDVSLFALGIFFIVSYLVLILWLGKRGPERAVARSDAKHEAIHYLQTLPLHKQSTLLDRLDEFLYRYVKTRNSMFSVIIKQLSLTFIVEGLILSVFFIVGGYLVFKGNMAIGEFIAAEIIILTVTYALNDLMKQIDYFYEIVEGFYKVHKLSHILGEDANI